MPQRAPAWLRHCNHALVVVLTMVCIIYVLTKQCTLQLTTLRTSAMVTLITDVLLLLYLQDQKRQWLCIVYFAKVS